MAAGQDDAFESEERLIETDSDQHSSPAVALATKELYTARSSLQ
jgi:hypothetical protein